MKIKKNIRVNILSSIIAGIVFSSCNDFLEVEPKDMLSNNSAWSSTENADLFLNNIYGSIPDPLNSTDYEDFYTDHVMSSLSYYYSRATYVNSEYTPSNGPSQWGLYSNIRSCNVFITNVSASDLDSSWKKTRLAEARFLRAYFYTLLWNYHGGVPIITDVLDRHTQGDDIFRARNTSEETVQFIIDECTAIVNDLPTKTAVAERITQGAALTLKAWCELYNASPLNNPDNDKTKWTSAANTYKQVMELKIYDLFPNHRTLFLEENDNNIEVIFRKGKKGSTNLGGSREGLWGVWKVNGGQKSWGISNPTQELVDCYFMANGLPISDPESGYDPQNPYANREQRFYNDIIYDGAIWLNYPIYFYIGAPDGMGLDLGDMNEASNTGYSPRKAMDERYAANGSNRLSGADYIIFRYAEVLLGYAEAQNEAVGPDESVYQAINSIRTRVDLPSLRAGLTQDQMREAIRQERSVELSMEEKRLRDLFRWKIAETALNQPVHAMKIEVVDGKKVYTVIPAPGGNKTFYADKNYLWPIPQSAMDRNSKLVQNPNY